MRIPEAGLPLSYSCTQRTGKPYARLLSFSGYTMELRKYKIDPPTLDAEYGELLQAKPAEPTTPRPPELLAR